LIQLSNLFTKTYKLLFREKKESNFVEKAFLVHLHY